MYLMRNHDVWIYVRCANSDPRIAFDRLYDLIDEAAGHGFLVRGTSFDHCSGNTLKDRIGLRSIRNKILQSFTVNPGRRIASGYFESCAESGRKLYR